MRADDPRVERVLARWETLRDSGDGDLVDCVKRDVSETPNGEQSAALRESVEACEEALA